MTPPRMLIDAFKGIETIDMIGIMLEDDGFDQSVVRALLAWQKTENVWVRPREPLPDDGKPTPRAWAWLVSGWEMDSHAVARGASLSIATARAKLEMLRGCRLIYPDGSCSSFATKAISAMIGDRMRGKRPPSEKARALEAENREQRTRIAALEAELRAKLSGN